MKTQNRKAAKKALAWTIKKYGRWFRLYMRRVLTTPREIGGELRAIGGGME